jgi:hypothetical protein
MHIAFNLSQNRYDAQTGAHPITIAGLVDKDCLKECARKNVK